MDQTRKSDTVYWYVVVGLLILAVVVVGVLWIMERRRATHLADQLRLEREATERNAQMIRQLLDAADGASESTTPDLPTVDGDP
ncbi:MAG: hypothetical protein ACYTFO_09250 [Planctomycetota bacterium]|jgi:hypothetical protein